MAKEMKITPNKTYASEANAFKAAQNLYGSDRFRTLRFFIMPTPNGRFFPVFVGEKAIQAGVHFNFNVIG